VHKSALQNHLLFLSSDWNYQKTRTTGIAMKLIFSFTMHLQQLYMQYFILVISRH